MESRPLPPPSNVNEHVSRFDPRAAAQEFEHELSPGMRDEPLSGGENVKRIIGLVAGPLLAVALFLLMPGDLGVWPRLVAATAVLMAVWWMTEALPIPATALLPLVVFPLGVPAEESDGGITFDAVGASYGNNIIFLFMGGFMLALAMQRWNLHRRIALGVLKFMGARTVNLVLGFMIATGFISMWVSNTATAVMMLPIGVSILVLVQRYGTDGALTADEAVDQADRPAAPASAPGEAPTQAEIRSLTKSNFGTALMLGIAYAASIGSLGTIIGTPPNTLMAGYLSDAHDITIGFGQWMLVGVPLAVVLMALCWLLLTKVLFKPEISEIPGGKELIGEELHKLGPMSSGEKRVLALFVLAAAAWILVPILFDDPMISDAGIAVAVGLLLFLCPAGAAPGVRLLDWETAVKLPWGVLLLFGGGLALSAQFSTSGLTEWIGQQVQGLGGLPVVLLVLLMAGGILLLTELTSNTATAATFLPVAGGVAMGIGVDPMLLAIPVALAATCAFMLPVATPPNAIAFGSGYVTVSQMIRGGVWLNLIALVLITITTMTLGVWVFGLTF